MPRNPSKQRCNYPGCRAWSMRDQAFCASHLRSVPLRDHAERILPLLRAVREAAEAPAKEDAAVLEKELHQLFRARGIFLAWIEDLPEDERRRLNPAQLLRAWNDSTARVIQLLRARRDLVGTDVGDLADLVQSAYDILERTPPAPEEEGSGCP